MSLNFEEFEPIYGEAKAEWEKPPTNTNTNTNTNNEELKPYLFRVFASPDCSHLKFHLTNFISSSWEATRSIHQFEDMRDSIGIGGSWSDFMTYIVASLISKHVKLILVSQSKSNGASSAKLVARKSKGMPLVSVTLSQIEKHAATEVMADFSFELFKAYGVLRDSSIQDQEHNGQLTRAIAVEQENGQGNKRKLDAATYLENQGFHRTADIENTNSSLKPDSSSITAALNSSEKQTTNEAKSTKVAHRAAPAHRRAKVRGVVLHDVDEEEGN